MAALSIVTVVVVVISFLSFIYRLLPHRKLSGKKPLIAFFPKYVVCIDTDIAVSNLEAAGFKSYKGTHTFVRGYYLGDFLARFSRLNVVFKEDKAYIHAPIIVILFDTGNLWKIAKDLQTPS